MISTVARLFRSLDWDTPGSKASLTKHWRIVICAVLGAIVATFVWHACFPNTFWFIQLWVGMATGLFVGVIPGAVWQIRDSRRRSYTSGRFIVGATLAWGAFAAISLFQFIPDLSAQEAERLKIRSLVSENILAISIRVAHSTTSLVENRDSIASFVTIARQSELFYPSHEGPEIEFLMTIRFRDGSSLEFEGSVPERHADDISLRFRGYFAMNNIIVPGGRRWLDNVVFR